MLKLCKSKHEALSSTPSTTKTKTKQKPLPKTSSTWEAEAGELRELKVSLGYMSRPYLKTNKQTHTPMMKNRTILSNVIKHDVDYVRKIFTRIFARI
jgi:hypothetical protein